ncbi:prephenate dehydrogenase [Microbacteriaceae bacterium 4G12]
MSMHRTVLIIGVGLIGGSIALAIKKEHDAIIVGYDINKVQVQQALELQVIDRIAVDLEAEAKQADLIVLASPVEETMRLLEQLSQYDLREDVIITDVGSTKGEIMSSAVKLYEKGVTFIGGHPMAGSHKTGVESAKGHLFENAFYILTPLSDTASEHVTALQEWLRGTRAHFLLLDTEQHDYVTGVVSHFPHIVAASLVRQVQKHAATTPLINRLAAGGFRDITRIASSSPKMWKDIVTQNRTHLLKLLEEWMGEVKQIQYIIQTEDADALYGYFSGAKLYRDALPMREQGAIPSYYDLYVDVVDKVGELARVTALLTKNEISITNLQILEEREGLLGVLRISFQTGQDREKAAQQLHDSNYQIYETL